MAKGKVAPVISSGLGLVKAVGGSNPYVALLTTAADLTMGIVQRRTRNALDEVDDSAKNFTEHSLTFSAAGEQSVDHKLDKTPTGFSVISSTSDCRLFQVSLDNRRMAFDANGTFPCTFKIRIF